MQLLANSLFERKRGFQIKSAFLLYATEKEKNKPTWRNALGSCQGKLTDSWQLTVLSIPVMSNVSSPFQALEGANDGSGQHKGKSKSFIYQSRTFISLRGNVRSESFSYFFDVIKERELSYEGAKEWGLSSVLLRRNWTFRFWYYTGTMPNSSSFISVVLGSCPSLLLQLDPVPALLSLLLSHIIRTPPNQTLWVLQFCRFSQLPTSEL